MPSRFFTALIFMGWLATMSWFFYREWWPEFRSDREPPFTVELADEASPQQVRWIVYRSDKKIGSAYTTMTYKQNDTFELHNDMRNLEIDVSLTGMVIPFRVPEFSTTQRVTRAGKLISVESTVKLSVSGFDSTIHLSATVKDGKLYPILTVKSFLLNIVEKPLGAVELKSASMWNPMHPHSKIRVRPGQRWQLAALDPLSDALKSNLGQIGPGVNVPDKKGDPTSVSFDHLQMLNAEVLPEPQELALNDRTYTCYVIEYRDADDITQKLVARTWIQVSDAKVIRQEAILMTDRLRLDRFE